MTWEELGNMISMMIESQKKTKVIVLDTWEHEYFPVESVSFADQNNDFLYEDQPYIRI